MFTVKLGNYIVFFCELYFLYTFVGNTEITDVGGIRKNSLTPKLIELLLL